MLLALGAVSSALDALQSLTASKSSSAPSTGLGQTAAAPFDLTGSTAAAGSSAQGFGSGGCSQISPETMSALIAAQSQSGPTPSASSDPSSALQDLFSQIDADGDGKITKSEFENALGAGGTNLARADDVFSKLDTDGNGKGSLDEMSKALKGAGHGGHHHHAGGSPDAGSTDASGSNTDALSQALSGASSNAVTNSDGSTTTSITYADGSKVTLTTPAASTASSAATSSYNLIEQLIQREAQALSQSATTSLSIAA
ncbi:MAG: EF-hand domain-containing protein [Alphaproteobacteria bacterium]|nr:MAG: EF-hand domain-containing protein [Alphaproteobacteria bacterium]